MAGEGLEPGTTKLQIQRPNHLATPRPKSITPKRKEKQFAKRRLVLISFLIGWEIGKDFLDQQ